MSKLYRGHVSHASSVEEHGEKMNFGKAPRVGQSRPYQAGSNAHGKHESRKNEPRGGPSMPMSQPKRQTY